MTLLYVDSFDHYATAEIPAKGWSTPGSAIISAGSGRRGGAALGTQGTLIADIATQSFTASDTIIVGCALKMTTFENKDLLTLKESGGSEVALVEQTSAGELRLTSGGISVITGISAFDPTAFSYYELKYVKGTGANAIAELRKDAVVILSITTSNETAQCSSLSVLENLAAYFPFLDDLYILNGLGTTNNNYLGDVRVDAHFADADGATVNFVGNTGATQFTHVDDPLPDNDTTFVEAGNINDRDLHSVGSASLGTVIHGVQQTVLSRKTDAGTVTVDLIVEKPGGTGEKVRATKTASDTYTYHLSVSETDPDDSTTWTDAKVNAQEFGYKINNIVT